MYTLHTSTLLAQLVPSRAMAAYTKLQEYLPQGGHPSNIDALQVLQYPAKAQVNQCSLQKLSICNCETTRLFMMSCHGCMNRRLMHCLAKQCHGMLQTVFGVECCRHNQSVNTIQDFRPFSGH